MWRPSIREHICTTAYRFTPKLLIQEKVCISKNIKEQDTKNYWREQKFKKLEPHEQGPSIPRFVLREALHSNREPILARKANKTVKKIFWFFTPKKKLAPHDSDTDPARSKRERSLTGSELSPGSKTAPTRTHTRRHSGRSSPPACVSPAS